MVPRIAEPDAAVCADKYCAKDELGSERGTLVTYAALPCCYEGERDWHGLPFVVCFDLLCV